MGVYRQCLFLDLCSCVLAVLTIFIIIFKAGFFGSAPDTGRGKSKMWKNITHGFHFVKGKSSHPMEDYVVSEFKKVNGHELGLFAIFDGHLGHDVAKYLQTNLFDNILKEVSKS